MFRSLKYIIFFHLFDKVHTYGISHHAYFGQNENNYREIRKLVLDFIFAGFIHFNLPCNRIGFVPVVGSICIVL